MKKALVIMILLCLCFIQTYAQDTNGTQISKDIICRGAAASVVGNVKPFFDLNRPKAEIMQITKPLVKESIKEAPSKAYDLLKAQKTKEEVINILYDDFMKLDEQIISKFLINTKSGDY